MIFILRKNQEDIVKFRALALVDRHGEGKFPWGQQLHGKMGIRFPLREKRPEYSGPVCQNHPHVPVKEFFGIIIFGDHNQGPGEIPFSGPCGDFQLAAQFGRDLGVYAGASVPSVSNQGKDSRRRGPLKDPVEKVLFFAVFGRICRSIFPASSIRSL